MKGAAGKATGMQRNITTLMKKAGLDGFVLALLVVIVLAWLWPQAGAKDSPFPLAEMASYGVSFIFFFYGLRLDLQKLRAGLKNWPLHLVVHLTTFLIFPLIV
ncbi:MAG: bile acid:sodium symporter, partial [Chitinophagaceae bacterium]